MNSFFQVINKNSKTNGHANTNIKNKKENEDIDNLKLTHYLSQTNRHQRNDSNQNEYLKTHINSNVFKTYTFYKNKDMLNEDDNNIKKLGKTVSGNHKFKALSSSIKKLNLKKTGTGISTKHKNLKIFNNDLISNHLNLFREKKYKEKKIKCLNIREIVNKNKINNLLVSCDNDKFSNNNRKETKQFTFTINKNSKKYPYSLRIIKRGKIIKNFITSNNIKTEYRKNNLNELNSVSYKPFRLLRRNAFFSQI